MEKVRSPPHDLTCMHNLPLIHRGFSKVIKEYKIFSWPKMGFMHKNSLLPPLSTISIKKKWTRSDFDEYTFSIVCIDISFLSIVRRYVVSISFEFPSPVYNIFSQQTIGEVIYFLQRSEFSNFSYMFLNPNNFFQFEL